MGSIIIAFSFAAAVMAPAFWATTDRALRHYNHAVMAFCFGTTGWLTLGPLLALVGHHAGVSDGASLFALYAIGSGAVQWVALVAAEIIGWRPGCRCRDVRQHRAD